MWGVECVLHERVSQLVMTKNPSDKRVSRASFLHHPHEWTNIMVIPERG